MGFEPRAAERLRLAIASAQGALDDIAGMLGEATDQEASPAAGAVRETASPSPAPRARARSMA